MKIETESQKHLWRWWISRVVALNHFFFLFLIYLTELLEDVIKDTDSLQQEGAHTGMYRHNVLHIILGGLTDSLETNLKPPVLNNKDMKMSKMWFLLSRGLHSGEEIKYIPRHWYLASCGNLILSELFLFWLSSTLTLVLSLIPGQVAIASKLVACWQFLRPSHGWAVVLLKLIHPRKVGSLLSWETGSAVFPIPPQWRHSSLPQHSTLCLNLLVWTLFF